MGETSSVLRNKSKAIDPAIALVVLRLELLNELLAPVLEGRIDLRSAREGLIAQLARALVTLLLQVVPRALDPAHELLVVRDQALVARESYGALA